MAWKAELDSRAKRETDRLDRLGKRVARMDDPRVIGKALRKTRAGSVCRYRIGDYHVVAVIIRGSATRVTSTDIRRGGADRNRPPVIPETVFPASARQALGCMLGR